MCNKNFFLEIFVKNPNCICRNFSNILARYLNIVCICVNSIFAKIRNICHNLSEYKTLFSRFFGWKTKNLNPNQKRYAEHPSSDGETLDRNRSQIGTNEVNP